MAGVALGGGVGVRAGPHAGLYFECVERHAGDDAAVFAGDVVGDHGVLGEGERDGAPVQFDDLDRSHGAHVSMDLAPAGRLRVCWRWSCTELWRTVLLTQTRELLVDGNVRGAAERLRWRAWRRRTTVRQRRRGADLNPSGGERPREAVSVIELSPGGSGGRSSLQIQGQLLGLVAALAARECDVALNDGRVDAALPDVRVAREIAQRARPGLHGVGVVALGE